MYNNYLDWLQNQRNILDELFARAGFTFYEKHKHLDNFSFDANETQKECYLLGTDRDLCYDRFTIGLSYSLWYQGKRTNAFISYFAKLLYEAREENEITLLDLGAGTGAVQLAISLCKIGLDQLFGKSPKITIINIDTSPFMLDYNRSYLWPEFIKSYEIAKDIKTIYSVNSWEQTDISKFNNFWITASYLFDQSDNVQHLSDNLSKLVETFEPRFIICNTSKRKSYLMNKASVPIKNQNYEVLSIDMKHLFTGSLPSTLAVRRKIKEECGVQYNGMPVWQENWMSSIVLRLATPGLSIPIESPSVDLFTPPLTVRRDIILSPEQKKAAEDDGRPTVIYGPAGCGKTVVITERIINILKNSSEKSIEEIAILVTTFNKGLVSVIKSWLKELLSREKFKFIDRGDSLRVGESTKDTITIMHFDVLPTRLWSKISDAPTPFKNDKIQFDNYHLSVAAKAINTIKKKYGITTNVYDHVLNDRYVIDEYHYVIYGQDIAEASIYAKARIKGRKRLERDGNSRKYLFESVVLYLELLGLNSSFVKRRHQFYKELKKSNKGFGFSHLIVDEFQDCTQTDYNIFYELLKNPNNLIICGDFAQAIHLGNVANIPRLSQEDMGRRKFIQLVGSYRLPYRISECLQNFSKNIVTEEDDIKNPLSPFKGAPPGARPILIKASNSKEMALKIKNAVSSYHQYDIFNFNVVPYDNILILEKDAELRNELALFRRGLSYDETILKVKGLEKKCVVWTARKNIEFSERIRHYVYTILTRTSGILIIALFGEECKEYVDIINEFDPDRVIIWDQDTKNYLDENYKL